MPLFRCKAIHKRITSFFLSLILFLSVLPAAHAEEALAVVNVSRLPVYASSSKNTVIGYLNQYDTVTVSSRSNGMARIHLNGKTGYADSSSVPDVDDIAETAFIKCDTYVYAAPVINHHRIRAEKNWAVDVIARKNGWAMVERQNIIAYIPVEYLSDLADNGNVVHETFPASVTSTSAKVYSKNSTSGDYLGTVSKGTTVNVHGYDSEWALISLDGKYGYCRHKYLKRINVSSAPAKTVNGITYEEFQARVSSTKVYVYASNSTKSTPLGSLLKGTVVTVRAYNRTWAMITLNGKTGFCVRSELERLPSPAATTPPVSVPKSDSMITFETFYASVSSASLSVHTSPSDSARHLGTLHTGATLAVYANNGTWAYVGLNGEYGYCRISGLRRLSSYPKENPNAFPGKTAKDIMCGAIFNIGATNEQKTFMYITNVMGYNNAVACGIMANISAESSFRPTAVSIKSYSGICQWTVGAFERLKEWCKENGLYYKTLESQLRYLEYSLEEIFPKQHAYLSSLPNNSSGAYEAGYYFCYNYERPSSRDTSSKARGNNASGEFWAKYGGY